MSKPKDIESPCNRQCCLDLQDICVGCKRSIQEIMEWSAATPQRKREILSNCCQRRQEKGSDLG
ncbi:DUF1289 domain-containing protein [Planctobacterium marinum]|uniref:DUF1289 domain-containing protein n=1 Tax=Planctobacterium marinum TaxID=1631968 RepID=UPI001E457885|nr:DUF1289 domain-containing protein [Planctobacterium marinum]MCC2607477.1 DUF1289 domain-containing protein [Planctobacterium marinum]